MLGYLAARNIILFGLTDAYGCDHAAQVQISHGIQLGEGSIRVPATEVSRTLIVVDGMQVWINRLYRNFVVTKQGLVRLVVISVIDTTP